MNRNNYDNKGMPLTFGVARALIREVFTGNNYVKRGDIVERILQYHTENGGEDTKREKVTITVKTVLSKLETEGLAERHPHSAGYWKIRKTQSSVSEKSSEQTAPTPSFIQDERERLKADLIALASEAKELAARATALESKAEELTARIGKL